MISKKYFVYVERLNNYRRRLSNYDTQHSVEYQANFKDESKALQKAKSFMGKEQINYIVVYELDSKNKRYASTDRKTRDGLTIVKKGNGRTYYVKKKKIYELGNKGSYVDIISIRK